jgi:excisionase family DNA binding protein
MARGRTGTSIAVSGETPGLDPLTALIRAAVRAELDLLRAELAAEQPAASPPRGPERLTIGEAARELRCSERQVRRLLATGRLRATKLAMGGSSRALIARAELDRLLAEATA